MEINFELKSEKTFDGTASSLEENLKLEGFSVLWELNLKEKLADKGIDLGHECKVFEICNPEKSKAALDLNQDAAYFLPCKVVLFDKAGEVRIGMFRPTLMMEMLGDPELLEMAHDIERHIKRAIMESV